LLPCFSFQSFSSEIDRDDLSYDKLQNKLNEHMTTYSVLLNSSHNKDIVVFLGKTGSGKSTVINYLLGKELLVEEDGDLQLKYKMDLSAMRIGDGSDSETMFPKSAMYKDLLLYDFPGFEDTRGLATDLLNALFIKDIIEKSKSVRFVFVAGKGEIEEGRGENLKKLIGIATDLIKGDIKDSSCLVITKNDLKTTEELGERIRKKCGQHPILNEWIKNDRLSFMSKPNAKEIRQEDRELILKSIYKSSPVKVSDIDVGIILKNIAYYKIREVYNQAMLKHEDQAREMSFSIAGSMKFYDVKDQKKSSVAMMEYFHQKIFDKDPVVALLKVFSNQENEIAKNILKSHYRIEYEKINEQEIRDRLESISNYLHTMEERNHERSRNFLEKFFNANLYPARR
jgi:GTPase SAR1 family protein